MLALTSGCDSSSSTAQEFQTPGPDCAAQLRFHGVTYTGYRRYRFTKEHPTRLGSAVPVCAGTTIDAGDPVAIWSFPSWSVSKVIGRQVYPQRYVVYVAESVKPRERARLLAAIRSSRG
jgi:hypothetical protein